MSNLREKLTNALAGATSQTPIATETLAQGHTMRSVKAELMAMHQERTVCCCEYCKGNDKPVVKWWPVGNVAGVLPQTASANRKAKAARVRK